MDTPVLVALVASGTAIVASAISVVASVYVLRRTNRVKARESSVAFLKMKVDSLNSQHKELLSESDGAALSADSLAKALHERLSASIKSLALIGHLLEPETRERLENRSEQISSSLAFYQALHSGLIKSPTQYTGDQGQLIPPNDLPRAISGFANNLREEMKNELVKTTLHIQRAIGEIET